jgi:hypothetical protein
VTVPTKPGHLRLRQIARRVLRFFSSSGGDPRRGKLPAACVCVGGVCICPGGGLVSFWCPFRYS